VTRWIVAAAAVGLGIAVISTSDGTDERALDAATAQVRAGALSMREQLLGVVSARGAPRGPALLRAVRRWLPAGPDVLTFHQSVRPDGAVVIRTAFHARGESGGGLWYESVVARLCVEFRASPGPPARADIRDIHCPATPASATGSAGNVDRTVTLEG
jgi:hypothetical protein